MTTIAYRAGVLAADTLVTDQGARVGHTDKIGRAADGRLWGYTGALLGMRRAVDWVEAGCQGEPPKLTEATLVVVDRDGRLHEWGEIGGPCGVAAAFYAFGSGYRLALGAMAAGASAAEAVRIAIEHDIYTGGTVRTLTLGGDDG